MGDLELLGQSDGFAKELLELLERAGWTLHCIPALGGGLVDGDETQLTIYSDTDAERIFELTHPELELSVKRQARRFTDVAAELFEEACVYRRAA